MPTQFDARLNAQEPASAPSEKGAMLIRTLEALEAAGISYCLLHGYEQYPANVLSDVDLLIPAEVTGRRLAKVLHANRKRIGASLVQWFDDGAMFIVLASDTPGPSPAMLQLHVSRDYEMGGRVFFTGRQIMQGCRRLKQFWVPAQDVEFTSVIVNRISKGKLTDDHSTRLAALYQQNPAGCMTLLSHYFSHHSAELIVEAASTGNWEKVRTAIHGIRCEMLTGRNAGRSNRISALVRRVRRWARPASGLHVVFLGPDGVGKSTVIETFQRDIEQAFLRSEYMTFAPSLIPAKFAPKKSTPHELPPRSMPASLVKAAWWLVCYTAGYFATVHSVLARGGLVVNHRYLIDAIVDQKRYRYSGPVWILRRIWAIAPKPNLVFLLDASAEVIRQRKSELPMEEITRQREKYRAVVSPLKFGHTIDASQPREKVVADTERLALDFLAARVQQRLRLGGGQ